MIEPAGVPSSPDTNQPRVSVVVPTRDRPHLLADAVESVRRQSRSDWELIIVDDGSREVVAPVIEAAGDPRVRVLRLDPGRGASEARNRGMRVGTAEFVAFLDDDDRWDRDYLNRMLEALEGSRADVAYCRRQIIHTGGERLTPAIPDLTGHRDPLRRLLCGPFIDTSTALVRRHALEDVDGFDAALPRLQDWDLWLRLARESKFVSVPAALVISRENPGGISDSPERLISACRRLGDRRPAQLRLGARQRGLFFYTLATLLMVGGAPGAARPFFVRSLKAWPWSPRRLAASVIAEFMPRLYRAVTRLRLTTGRR